MTYPSNDGGMSRTALANLIDECDVSIKDFNDSKREAFTSYRTKLENAGWDKDAIKAEIEAVKIAIKRRRVVKVEGIEVIEGKDELVEEVLTEILTSRAPRATRVENITQIPPKTADDDGRKLSVSSPSATAIEPEDRASGVGQTSSSETPHGDGDIADAVSGDGPCMEADIAPADEGDEPTEGGENVDPQVLGEVETHASPAINPDCAHPDTCQFATKSYCCSQCSSARSARLQAQRKVRA